VRTKDHLRHSQIEIVEVRTVRTYDRNARLHSDEQVANIATAIQRFGFTNPVLIDEDGQLIAGHGRLAAAQRLGLDKIPAIRIAGLSEDERRMLVLVDNRLSETSTGDEKMLAEELRALQFAFDAGRLDVDLDSVGFSDAYVKDLMVLLEEPGEPEPPRQIEVEDEPAVARPGDTWQLGMHRLSVGGKEAARDADLIIRQWERETKDEAKLVGSGITFKSRAANLGIEFVRP
jgi:ParB-like chromosome segregation protein Spo0J